MFEVGYLEEGKIVDSKPKKIRDVVDVINQLYKPVKLVEIEKNYLQIKPKLLQAVVANKTDFLSFIGDIVLESKSLRAYIDSNELEPFKKIVECFDKLDTLTLDRILSSGIKHYTIIKFLKSFKHPIINTYKSKVVEPLIGATTRLVLKLAKEVNLSLSFEDKVMLGLEGLIDAAWRYEPCKGFKFTTYARHWIRQRMFTGIETGLKVPSGQMMKFHKLYPLYRKYRNETNNGDIDGFVEWLQNHHKDKSTLLLDSETIKMILSVSQVLSYESLAEKYENRTSDDFIDSNHGLCDSQFENFVENFENKDYLQKFSRIAKSVLSQLEYNVFMMLTFGSYKREEVRQKCGFRTVYEVDKVYRKAITKLKKCFPDKHSLLHLKPLHVTGNINHVL